MEEAETSKNMSTGLMRVMERARQNPSGKMRSLAHHIDVEALERSFHRIRRSAAVGVDGVTKEAYGENLEDNLADLHSRLKGMKYRHQPIRRSHLPKGGGKTRPIGISTTEDKVVQGALGELLGVIYEQEFLDCSYGFRPGRSAHDALKELNRSIRYGEADWILKTDVAAFFDSMDRPVLRGMLEERIEDKSLMRLIGKCIHVGVLDGAEFQTPEVGTAQGSILSPLLGNIYLHHVIDRWYENEVKPRMQGRSCLVRYADDLLFGFEAREDAERVMRVLAKRLSRYGLRLSADKTELLNFRRPSSGQQGGKGPSVFDFLGFTHYWRRSRKGRWFPAWKTRKKSLQKAVREYQSWCKANRHLSIPEQHAALTRRIRGHFNYFGVNGNHRSLSMLRDKVERSWFRWLRRRSQRTRMTWERFKAILKALPLPPVKVYRNLWAAP
jgi:group II intron reverse transcriptase/maturase